MSLSDSAVKWIIIENIATVVSAAFLVATIFYLSESFHAFWGLAILGNISSFNSSKDQS